MRAKILNEPFEAFFAGRGDMVIENAMGPDRVNRRCVMTRMHPAWNLYFQIGALCAPWLDAAILTRAATSEADIVRLFGVAEKNGAASALAWLLRDKSLSPGLRRRADDILANARSRAERRVAAIEAVAGALNAIGVRPLLLKGCAAQLGGVYPDPGFRTMSDVDLLVAPDQFAASVAVVERLGFASRDSADYGHTHAPQYHAGLDVTIEVHRRLAPVHARHDFPAAPLLAQAHTASVGQAEVLLPDWAQHAAMTILHTLAWDRTRYMAFVPLKPMLDLAALKASGLAVDWSLVGDLLERGGENASLEHIETLFRAFFGVALTGRPVPERRARNILRYYRAGATWPLFVTLARLRLDLGDRLKLLLRRPALAGRLLTPALYARLAERIRLAWRES